MAKRKGLLVTMAALVALAVMAGGCSKRGGADDGAEINIGGIFPLSGRVAVYGIEARNGVELAVEEINAAGGINGKMLRLISEDDEGNPEKTVNAYKKLTTRDNVKLIIGSLTSGCTQAITALAQKQQVVLVAPAATEASITSAGNFIFRACFIDPFQGTVGGIFAAQNLGARTAAILYDNGNDYSTGLGENFITAFRQKGGTIVAEESYGADEVDFNAQLISIKTKNPDVVYLPDYYNTVARIAKQLRDLGMTMPIVGADGWDGILDHAGNEILNGFYSNHYSADSDDPKVQNFVSSYQRMFSSVPVSFAALAYDSLYLLRDAIARAGTADSVKVRNELAKTNGNYVTGNLVFDSKRNPVKSAIILEIVNRDGKLSTSYTTTINP